MQPAYGSGPFVSSVQGTGFFTKADYIEIVKYANERHIEVIPEIDLPGHARAAIVAMKVRHEKLLAANKKAEADQYLLHDPNDQSEYLSVQYFNDNVISVCQESTYNFLEKIVQELISMHQEAGAPLKIVHTGGDEVPAGVWEKSPACAELLKNNKKIVGTKIGLTNYFLKRFSEILNKNGLVTGGWEEIALKIEDHDHSRTPNPEFIDSNFLPYVWNAVPGWGGEDIAYQLANVGYPVVLCNASNLYFDMAYDKDSEEPGFYWADFVDTRKVWAFVPFDFFKTVTMGRFGEELKEAELAKGKITLSAKGKANILGIQGELWSETLINPERLEASSLPKLLGLAERAWAAQPEWASEVNVKKRFEKLETDWNQFANTLGQKELPRLDYLHGGYSYRIPPPGAIVENGKVYANTAFPGMTIRYTLDGSEPNLKSAEYTEPFVIKGTAKLKAFSASGTASRTVGVEKQLEN